MYLIWHTFLVGSVAHEPSLLSDFGLACFLGLYEEVKKARFLFFFSKCECECGFTHP